ncbi:peptide chain release factor N(5)-glutamine methyltransferase [bacterium]|nr:peptide chain release factor N(5)-glutamine methyltransferase [bacterium]
MTAVPPSPRTLLEYLQKATGFLAEREVESPRLSAELLLADLLGASRLDLYLRFEEVLSPGVVEAYRERLRRRARHEPLPYIIGKREFYGRQFHVTPAVLIPRPETEHLVEVALTHMRASPPGVIMDVGTGSGVLAGTLLCECPEWRGLATDTSREALAVARENARRLGVADRLEFREGSLYTCLLPGENFAVIVANPPYIRNDEWDDLPRQVRDFEPAAALRGGADGMDVLRPLILEAPSYLAAGGILAVELGETQGAAVLQLAGSTGLADARVLHDLAGKPRVLVAHAGQSPAGREDGP